jgi:hypothetical protein
MNDPEGFLTRWSRRKQQADEVGPDSVPDPARMGEAVPAGGKKEQDKQDKKEKKIAATDPKDTAPEPAFDLKSLPSIESITATTDIRPFLAPGVPAELTRAALRRVWVADPAIRDYIGLSENSWDFNAADGMHGFGPLLPTDDVKRLLAEVFGERPVEQPRPEAESTTAGTHPSSPEEPAPQAGTDSTSHRIVNVQVAGKDRETETKIAAEQKTISERVEDDAATQQDNEANDAPSTRTKRGHGGALPA